MSATSQKITIETPEGENAVRNGSAASNHAPIEADGTTARPVYAAPFADHGTGLILLAALLAAAGVACTATSVTLLLRPAQPGRVAPHVIGFAGMTLMASSALCLIILSAR